MCGRTTGSSRSACRFVPEPDTSTAMRASIGRTLPRGPECPGPGRKLRPCRRKSARRRGGAMREPSVAAHGRHVRRVRPAALRRVRGPRPRPGARDRSASRRSSATTSRRRPPRVRGGGRVRPSTAWWERRSPSRVLATLFPWTRFSTGSGFAGAWALEVRWSMLTACAAVIGLVALVRVRTPAAGGADRRDRHRDDRSPRAPCSPRSTRRRSPNRRSRPWIALAAGAVAACRRACSRLQVSTAPHV